MTALLGGDTEVHSGAEPTTATLTTPQQVQQKPLEQKPIRVIYECGLIRTKDEDLAEYY